MKTPSRLSPEQLCDQIVAWLNEHARDHGGHYHCNGCGTVIAGREVSYSLHDAAFGEHCAGAGQVKVLTIPFCPRCEAMPEERGCLHLAELPAAATVVLQ